MPVMYAAMSRGFCFALWGETRVRQCVRRLVVRYESGLHRIVPAFR